jgi:hypothetical protein
MPNIRKGATAALAGATTTEFPLVQSPSGTTRVTIKTASGNAGTIQFAVAAKGGAGPVMTAQFAYAASQTIVLTLTRNDSLWAKASAATQNFLVEY